MPDRYLNFQELARHETEGVDYKIHTVGRGSRVAIIAPHGGKIEPGTTQITLAIAGDVYSSYCFEGHKKLNNSDLHVTSANFNEPRCLELLAECDHVVTVHGLGGTAEIVEVGGLATELRDGICDGLTAAGFKAEVVTSGPLAGTHRDSVCNRGRNGAGVQLEISRGLRDALINDPERLTSFAVSVQQAIG